MALEEINWNTLYAAQPEERDFAEARIRAHFKRMRLSRRGAVKAAVRYGSCILRRCVFSTDRFLQTNGLAWGEWCRKEWRAHRR